MSGNTTVGSRDSTVTVTIPAGDDEEITFNTEKRTITQTDVAGLK